MTIIRTTEGDIGILKNHEPTVAPVSIGAIKIINGDKKIIAACAGGFVSVSDEKVTVISDAAEWSEEINVDRALDAIKRAKQDIAAKKSTEDVLRARAALSRAMNRVRISGKKIDHSNL